MEEYSEGKIHMSEPELGKGNVNTVYFARGGLPYGTDGNACRKF